MMRWTSGVVVVLILFLQPCYGTIINKFGNGVARDPAVYMEPASSTKTFTNSLNARSEWMYRKAARVLQAANNNKNITAEADDFGGSEECPCIDSSIVLSTISNCVTDAGSPGFGTARGACYPLNFGAFTCGAHDMIYDPLCLAGSSNGGDIPSFCYDKWCYVDYDKCKMSEEFIYRSSIDFGTNKQDLFYSYSVCSSTAAGWLNYQAQSALEGITLIVTIPRMLYPDHYKLDEDGSIATDDSYYYNDNIPWTGSIIDYLNAIVAISNIGGITYTSRSAGADNAHPESSYTATVHDVTAGIGEVGGGNFWITSQRLSMTTYTTPFDVDRIDLFIQQPEPKKWTILDSAQRIALPFATNLWILLFFVVFLTAILIVWLDRTEGDRGIWNERTSGPVWDESSTISKLGIVFYAAIDSFIIHSAYILGHTTELDPNMSLAQKIIIFGFAIVIFIAAAAYTANLAAFLTLSGTVNFVSNMEEAVATNTPVCANPILEDDLIAAWPNANFVFNRTAGTSGYDSLMGMLAMYDAGECGAIGYNMDNSLVSNYQFMEEFCQRNLVSTRSPLIEKPLAFPIRSELSAGLSYWMYEADKRSINYKFFQEQRLPSRVCSFRISEISSDDFSESLNPASMMLPLLVWVCCISIAILGYLWSLTRKKKSKQINEIQQQEYDTDTASQEPRRISYLSPRSVRQRRISANSHDDHESETAAFSDLLQKQHEEIMQKLSDIAATNRGLKECKNNGSGITCYKIE